MVEFKVPRSTDEEARDWAERNGWPVERARAYLDCTDTLIERLGTMIFSDHLGLHEDGDVFVVEAGGENKIKLDAAMTALAEVLGKVIGVTYAKQPEDIRRAMTTALGFIGVAAQGAAALTLPNQPGVH